MSLPPKDQDYFYAPDYSMKHVRFTHGVEEQTAFDDCGESSAPVL